MPVYQRQALFYLPDLTDMEVVALLHESIVKEINPGLRATVHVEGLANRRVEGHVKSIASMALTNWRSDVRYFESIVKLENVPDGLRPGMTAEVTIAMPRIENVLAVPPEAVRVENGHDFCFVIHDDGVERREIELGQVTSDLAQVTKGLEEGEQVVLGGSKDDLDGDELAIPADLPAIDPAPAKAASLSSPAIAALR